MLKQCLINVDFARMHAKQQLRPKCGEIYYESDNEFCGLQFVCCLCEMKHFAFDDFLMHIRNVHFDKNGKPRTQLNSTKVIADSTDANTNAQQKQELNNLKPKHEFYELNANECSEFLFEDGSDDSDDVADDEITKPLRVCSFKDVKLEPALNETNESAHCEDSSHSEDVLDTTQEDGQCFSDTDDGVESETQKTQSVFKKQRQPKEFKCKYCEGKYTSPKYLKMHLKMSHPHPKGFRCSDCDATFDVDRALETHRRKEHTEFTCNLCEKVYKSARTLLRHVQGHSGLRQYKCEYENCGKSFVSQHNLTSHRRVHSTERNYVCELCGYRSRYRDALFVHRRTHTGEKPFKCQTCERCFASKSLLNEHQAMHSTERPYKCDKCDAAFSRPKALYHHKHLHLGIKKFKCKICGNAYAQAAGLSAHMRGHKAQAVNGIADCAAALSCPP